MAEKEKTNWFKKHKVLTGVLIFVGLVIIAGAFSGGETTNNTSSETAQPSTSSAPVAEEKKETKDFDPEVAYKQIESGMTKAQVEKVTGKKSSDCTESTIEGLGTTEICNYGGFSDKGIVTVTYDNGKVNSKTKTIY